MCHVSTHSEGFVEESRQKYCEFRPVNLLATKILKIRAINSNSKDAQDQFLSFTFDDATALDLANRGLLLEPRYSAPFTAKARFVCSQIGFDSTK